MEKAVVTSLNSKNSNSVESVTLSEWVSTHYSEDELSSVFLNMDKALKYIHEHGYCIEVFYPTEINVLNGEDDHIQFKKLVELSKDENLSRQMIKEDIFRSSLIQVGVYSNSLKYLNPDFLKENFDAFTQFIPKDDVPYYRGVIQRGASVYYSEFREEKTKRDIEELEKTVAGNDKAVVTSIPTDIDKTNRKVNDIIYRQINGMSEAAFLNIIIIPVIILIMIIIFITVMLIINFVG